MASRIQDGGPAKTREPQRTLLTALPPTAYTDFFLPLLSRCPSAMGIKNKDGETPGQILGWGPPWDSAEEEEEDEASKEREWRQKLQGELEDEWQEVIGRFEGKESVSTHSHSLPCCTDAATGFLRPLALLPCLSGPSPFHCLSPTTPSCPTNR